MGCRNRICNKAIEVCTAFARSDLEMRVTMVDFSGNVIGQGQPLKSVK